MPLNIDIRDYSKKSTFNKVKFFTFSPGQHVIRILDEDIPLVQCYWFGTGCVQALGFDDPQALQNRKLKLENPENYKNIRGYRPIMDRYHVNVLDRTPVKICPRCEREVKSVNGTFPMICPSCEEGNLTNVPVKPLDEVRVLQGGKRLFEQFRTLDMATLDSNNEPIGVQNFDIQLVVVGAGNQRTIVALALADKRDEVNVPPEDKFDTSTIIPKVTEEEMEQLVRGVALRDVFAARTSVEEATSVESPDTVVVDLEEVKKKVDQMFN